MILEDLNLHVSFAIVIKLIIELIIKLLPFFTLCPLKSIFGFAKKLLFFFILLFKLNIVIF